MAISKLNPIDGGIPKGNTNNRSVEFPSPVIGDVYYNGTLEILEIYNGTAWVAVSAPPATPSIATPTDASTADAYTSTAGKLSVVFTPGSGGGTPNQYNAYTTSGGYSGFDSTSTVLISGLTPGTSYTVYGNAQNNFGTTVNTANAAAVTPTTLPQVPTIGTATASVSTNEVTVTWTNGSNGGKVLSAITITPFLNGTTAETSRTAASISSTSYTFTEGQLTPGSSYTFKVKATNANGTSNDSSASGSVTVPSFVNTTYLVIAGGGGGGGAFARGAAGAGGYRSSVSGESSGRGASAESILTLSKSTNYTITVGAGGANGGGSDVGGSNGTNSVFSTITSIGGGKGGGGGSDPGRQGGNGGCGGGSNYGGAAGTGTSGQGYDGGVATTDPPNYGGGGGGGAGAAGTNGTGSTGGNGGNGVSSSITGSSVTRAGGGAGGRYQTDGVGGTPGTGGGGSMATNGTDNTGGGGGGCNSSTPGGNGGKGVVIIRWLTSSASITVGAGLTADSTGTDGSYSYKRFTEGSGNVSFA